MGEFDGEGGAGTGAAAVGFEEQRDEAGHGAARLTPALRELAGGKRAALHRHHVRRHLNTVALDFRIYTFNQMGKCWVPGNAAGGVFKMIAHTAQVFNRAAIRQYGRHYRLIGLHAGHQHKADMAALHIPQNAKQRCQTDGKEQQAVAEGEIEKGPVDLFNKYAQFPAEGLLSTVQPCRDPAAGFAPGMGQVGRQNQKAFQPGDQKNSDHHRRNDTPGFPHHARNKRERQKCRHVRQNAESDGNGYVFCPLNRRLQMGHALLTIFIDVLARHDGVIDHNPEGDDEREHGNHVDAHPHQRQEQHCAQKRNRDAHGDPEREFEFEKQPQGDQHQHQAHERVFQEQLQALTVDIRAVVVDGGVQALRNFPLHIFENFPHRVRDTDRRFATHAHDPDSDRRHPFKRGLIFAVLKGLLHLRDLPKPQNHTLRTLDQWQVGKLTRPVPALIEADQNLPAIGLDAPGGQLHRAAAKGCGHLLQREAVRTQPLRRNGHQNFRIARPAQIHLRDSRMLQQSIADVLRLIAQGSGIHASKHLKIHHAHAPHIERNFRVFRIDRERIDPIHRLPQLLINFLSIRIFLQFHPHHTASLRGRGTDFLDAIDSPDRFFHRQNNPLLDFFGTGTRIRDANRHRIQIKFRKHLLFDARAHEKAAHQEKNHEQIGSHPVVHHPGREALVFWLRHGPFLSAGTSAAVRRAMPSTATGRSVVISFSPASRPPATYT